MGEVLDDYFKAKGCNYWQEQSKAYGHINFKFKSVVIIGADCGTTAIYAFLRGASYVIMYESDPKLRQKLFDVMDDFGIEEKSMRYTVSGLVILTLLPIFLFRIAKDVNNLIILTK